MRHVVVDYDRHSYCGHPRQCGIANFGGGELAVLYWRAPCAYENADDVSHSFYRGYASRADVVLRRSFDHGDSWRPDSDVVVWSNAWSLMRRREFLEQDPDRRELLDMSQPEAMYFFGRTALPNDDNIVPFQLRSTDKGQTWERVALVLDPPPASANMQGSGNPAAPGTVLLKDNHPLVTMPDGSVVGAVSAGPPGAVWLYGSENHGMTWQCLSRIAVDDAEVGRPTCASPALYCRCRLPWLTMRSCALRLGMQTRT
eukprot:SAG31_NODE_21_length_34109_cov_60.598824_18_plen_257_part_00